MRIFSGLLLVCAVSLALPSHAQVTRVEHNDPAVTYTGNWYNNTAAGDSGGMATLANQLHSIAAITFNGTGITWIGTKDPQTGMAWVNLDGKATIVDTYAATTQYQQPLFTASGLPAGPHT